MTDATERAQEILVGLTDGPDCKHHEGLSVFCALCARTAIAAALAAEREEAWLSGFNEAIEEVARDFEYSGSDQAMMLGKRIRALVGAGGEDEYTYKTSRGD